MKINVPERNWAPMGVLSPQSIRQFKGENTLDAFSIEKTYGTRAQNVTGSEFPGMSTRPGNTAVGTVRSGRILGLGVWKDNELHAIANGTWSRYTSGAWSDIATGLNTSAPWSFCNFQGNLAGINLLAANGVDPIKRWDGTSVSSLTDAPSNGNYIDQHDNRVYAAEGNTVHFSALRKADDWTTVDDAGTIVVETNNGETINGMKAGSRHLMVFKPSSIHELWGTGPLNYQMTTVASDIGLLSNQCVTVIQGIPHWMDTNGIYRYGGSRPTKDFSLPVKAYIDGLNKNVKEKACAGTDGKNLYVGIPYDTATDPDTILEYNNDFQLWTVWKSLSPLHFAQMSGNWYFGDTAGYVRQIGGTTDNGTAITYDWVSAPFGGGSLAQKLQWYRMWYVCDVPAGSTMNVYLSPSAEGDSDWVLVKAIAANDLQSGRVIIPVDTVANANWVRVRLTGTGPMKVTELDYQLRELPMY
jgi:hypothetical protein